MSLNCETIKIILPGDENAMYDRVSVTNLNIGWRDFQRSGRVKNKDFDFKCRNASVAACLRNALSDFHYFKTYLWIQFEPQFMGESHKTKS